MIAEVIDTHLHIIDPARFPFQPGAGYRPTDAELGDVEACVGALAAKGVGHAVIVQPSCYGYDNTATLSAIAHHPRLFKGICMVPTTANKSQMEALEAQGIAGLRINFGSFDPQFLDHPAASALLRNAADIGWIIQAYAIGEAWSRIAPVLAASGATVLIDHFGQPDTDAGLSQPGFGAVLAAASSPIVYAKLSSIFRVSKAPFPHRDVDPYVRAVVDTFGSQRCVWGSDWPFLGAGGGVSYDDTVACIERLIPNETERHAILWETPLELYGWSESAAKEGREIVD